MRVELIQQEDRPALCQMLEDSDDFPRDLVRLYRRAGSYATFVAWRGCEIVGMLSGSLDSDFAGNPAFDSFELPAAPHAFLDRVHVRGSVRRTGVGRALIEAYAIEAAAHGCTFIAGSIDLSSDARARRTFFEDLSFEIRAHDNFGARVEDVLARIATSPSRPSSPA